MTKSWSFAGLLLQHSEGYARRPGLHLTRNVFLKLVRYCPIHSDVLDEPAVMVNRTEKRLHTLF